MPRAPFGYVDTAIGVFSFIGACIAAMALATIAGSVAVEVVARSILRSPTIWAIEVATYSLIVAGFLGSAYVLRQGRHLEVTLVIDRFSPRMRNRIGILTDLLSMAFCILVVYFAIRFVGLSRMIGAVSVSELRVPLWIPQLVVPVGFTLLSMEFFARILVRLGLVPDERFGVLPIDEADHT